MFDGSTLGSTLGNKDGKVLGMGDDRILGSSEGFDVGTRLGNFVGSDVGRVVGFSEGNIPLDNPVEEALERYRANFTIAEVREIGVKCQGNLNEN